MANAFITNAPSQPVPVSIKGDGFTIATHDYSEYAYYGSTNNIHTITYKSGGSGGTTVNTVTFAYAGGGAGDDDTLTSLTLT